MKLVVAIFAILTAIPLSAEEILVPPPQLNQVAKAHHCSLLIWAEREDQPLRSCPDEIPNVKRIGRPELDAWPKIPRDFVMIDTGERLTVREPRVMFGVENHLPEGVDYYACVTGRWAHYSPEKK